jgi:ppGpp synthetase/RelA/SpoT-type nucleotidyltranferase
MVQKKFTNGDINRLGDKIRESNDSNSEKLLQELEYYRTSHKDSIADIFRKICQIKHKVSTNTIVTYRIKRFESIINKLKRFPDMKFSRMWDIGGCRCIVANDREVYKLKEAIEKVVNIRKINDYIESPKENGYRSLHLYGNLEEDGKVVEIQIRNQRDHNWATLVEISDLLFDSGLKEYNRDEELLQLHKLLAKRVELTYQENRLLAKIIMDTKYLDKLSQTFTRNHLRVREQWLSIETKSRHKYFLIKASKDSVPEIKAFDNFQDAELEYFEDYKKNQKINIVLTHLPKPRYEKISIAYSNYILTMHSFEDYCSNLFQYLTMQSIKETRYRDFFKYYTYYQDLIFNNVRNAIEEIKYSSNLSKGLPSTLRNKIKKKEHEWKKDIEKELKENLGRAQEFKKLFSQNLPESKFKRFWIKRIVKYTFWKQKKKYKKLDVELEAGLV